MALKEKKKTKYLWIVLILTALGIVLGLIYMVSVLMYFKGLLTGFFGLSSVFLIIQPILSIIGLIIGIIFFFKLYNVAPDLIKWTNITFGYIVFLSITSAVYGLIVISAVIPVFSAGLSFWLSMLPKFAVSAIPLIIFIVIWITFVNHLKKAQKENLMDFS